MRHADYIPLLRVITKWKSIIVASVCIFSFIIVIKLDWYQSNYPRNPIPLTVIQSLKNQLRDEINRLNVKGVLTGEHNLVDEEEGKHRAIWNLTNSLKILDYGRYVHDDYSHKLNELLDSLKSNCDKLLVYRHHQNNGLGSEFHWIQVALTVAVITGRSLLIEESGNWIYADPSVCKSKTWSCYFQSLSNCQYLGIGNTALPFIQYDKLEDFRNEQIVVFNDSDRSVWEWIPKEYQHKGLFWWRSQLSKWMFKPKTELFSGMEAKYQNILRDAMLRAVHKYDHQENNINVQCAYPIISVHTRHGDKVFGSKYNQPEMRYISYYETLGTLYSIWQKLGKRKEGEYYCAFIASKNPDFIRRIVMNTEESLENGIIVLFDTFQKRTEDFSTIDLMERRLNGTDEAIQTIIDILLLLKGDIFLGAMESNLSRLIMEIGAASWVNPPVVFEGPGWHVNP